MPGPSQKAEAASEGTEVSKKVSRRSWKHKREPCRPAASAADFFLPVSKKVKLKRAAHSNAGGAGEEVEGGPPDGELVSRRSTKSKEANTPRLEKAAPSQGTPSGKILTEIGKGLPVVGLREERRLAAQEDARQNAGKPLHPFFTRQVPTKIRRVNPDDLRSSKLQSAFFRTATEPLYPSPPFHVTQSQEEQGVASGWVECCPLDVVPARTQSSRFPEVCGTISLCIREQSTSYPSLDKVIGHFSSVILSLHQKKLSNEQQQTCGSEKLEDMLYQYLKNAKLHHQLEEDFWLQQYCQATGEGLSRQSLRKRAASFKGGTNFGRVCPTVGSSLWTEVYKPRSPQDVCGNVETVAFVNSWLESWRNKILGGGNRRGKSKEADDDYDDDDDDSWFQCDNGDDNDSKCKAATLMSVLLLTGPLGCGKTAAVYASATSHGFAVIELSSSDVRNGALVKQKFGEALESHRLPNWAPGVKRTTKDDQASGVRGGDGRLGRHRSGDAQPNLTLLLVEDVDVVFDGDRGLSSALVKLASTSKRPIILTSNKRRPILPPPLLKLTKEFKQPCTQALVLQACMATAAQGCASCPRLMECLVKACRHDMRQVMMMLQFWNHGRSEACSGSKAGGEEVVLSKDSSGMKTEDGSASSLPGTEEIHGDARKTVAPDSGVQDSRRSILLPLSFSFSLIGHLAQKISEAAWQLHYCATYAGVLGIQGPTETVNLSIDEVQSAGPSEVNDDGKLEVDAMRVRKLGLRAKSVQVSETAKPQRVVSGASLSTGTDAEPPEHQCMHAYEAGGSGSRPCQVPAESNKSGGLQSDGVQLELGGELAPEVSVAVFGGKAESGSQTYAEMVPSAQSSLAVPTPRRKRRLCKLRDLKKKSTTDEKLRTSWSEKRAESAAIAHGGGPVEPATPAIVVAGGSRERFTGLKMKDSSSFLKPGSGGSRVVVDQRRQETIDAPVTAVDLAKDDMGPGIARGFPKEGGKRKRKRDVDALRMREVGLRAKSIPFLETVKSQRAVISGASLSIGTDAEHNHKCMHAHEADCSSFCRCQVPAQGKLDGVPLCLDELGRELDSKVKIQKKSKFGNRSSAAAGSGASLVSVPTRRSRRRLCKLRDLKKTSISNGKSRKRSKKGEKSAAIAHAGHVKPATPAAVITGSTGKPFTGVETKGMSNVLEPGCCPSEETLETLGAAPVTVTELSKDDVEAEENKGLLPAASGRCPDAVEVLDTMCRLTDALSLFDLICSRSERELDADHCPHGYHLDSLEKQGTYLAECSVHLCLQQCSQLLNSRCAENRSSQGASQGLPDEAALDFTSLDWLESDANPCDADHNMRGEARRASLTTIVTSLVPRRRVMAARPALHDYSAGLALICKLEENRRAAAAAGGNGLVSGSRRTRGHRFRHHLRDIADADVACLLSHSQLGRGKGAF